MKYPFRLCGLAFLILSCASEPLTSEEIARKCQEYHDTDGQWYNKIVELELESKSVFSDNNTEDIKLRIDNKSNTFEYNNLFRGVHLEYGPDYCKAYNDSSECEAYEWTYKFYPYIWGMPAKFFDPGVKVKEGFEDEVINEVPVYVIHIDYENENYDFYVNRNSFYLEGFRFVKTDGSGGEIIFNEGSRNINGMIMPTRRTWYDLEMNLLGTDILL